MQDPVGPPERCAVLDAHSVCVRVVLVAAPHHARGAVVLELQPPLREADRAGVERDVVEGGHRVGGLRARARERVQLVRADLQVLEVCSARAGGRALDVGRG